MLLFNLKIIFSTNKHLDLRFIVLICYTKEDALYQLMFILIYSMQRFLFIRVVKYNILKSFGRFKNVGFNKKLIEMQRQMDKRRAF
jgi:hypothetical protein